MKILLSVFECDPMKGSDAYVGWAYVTHLAKFDQIYALTRTENRESIEHYLSKHPISFQQNIHFLYVPQGKLFLRLLKRFDVSMIFLASYFFWQKTAYRRAKKVCAEEQIDICHHVSIADFRCPGYLWKCGKPFILGPVGGGQETPPCLREYTRGFEKAERFRSALNRLMPLLPNYRKALRHAALIFSSNDETMVCIRKKMRKEQYGKLIRRTELGIADDYLKERELPIGWDTGAVRVIVSGRLIYRKGVALLLDAVARIRTTTPFTLEIFGDGTEKEELISQAQRLGLEKTVRFHGKIQFAQMQQQYRESDIFVLPSLRETTGTAVFEAMANRLPVVSLNQNGVKYIVEQDAGILVDVISKEQVLSDLAQALTLLIENCDLRIAMGNAGYEKLRNRYTWTRRIQEIKEIYQKLYEEKEIQGIADRL